MSEDHESPASLVVPVLSPQDDKAQKEIIDKYGPQTVTDLLRHGLTGELPEAIEDSLKQTAQDQIAPLKQKPKEISKEPTPILTLHDYDEFTHWSRALLSQLEGTLELGDSAPATFQNRIIELEEQFSVFDNKASQHFSDIRNDEGYSALILEKWNELSDKLKQRILGNEDDPRTKATLVSLLYHLESGTENAHSKYFRVVSPVIDQLLEKGEFECLGDLLHREKGVERYTFRSLKNKRSKLHLLPTSAVETLLEPLIAFTSHTVKTNGLEGLNTVGVAYYIADLVAQHSDGLVQAIENHAFPIAKLQEQFVNALSQDFDKIIGPYPSHNCTQDILVALIELYKVKPIASGDTCPPNLRPLLHKLYVEKVIRYNRKAFDYFFDQFPELTGISLQDIKSMSS